MRTKSLPPAPSGHSVHCPGSLPDSSRVALPTDPGGIDCRHPADKRPRLPSRLETEPQSRHTAKPPTKQRRCDGCKPSIQAGKHGRLASPLWGFDRGTCSMARSNARERVTLDSWCTARRAVARSRTNSRRWARLPQRAASLLGAAALPRSACNVGGSNGATTTLEAEAAQETVAHSFDRRRCRQTPQAEQRSPEPILTKQWPVAANRVAQSCEASASERDLVAQGRLA